MALAAVRPEDCPFWLEADRNFSGMQGDAERLILFLESRGQVALNLRAQGDPRFSGPRATSPASSAPPFHCSCACPTPASSSISRSPR
jgi:hypothetical protein